MEGKSRPVRVTAIASTGVATGQYQIETEDTITLAVQWLNNGEYIHTCDWRLWTKGKRRPCLVSYMSYAMCVSPSFKL